MPYSMMKCGILTKKGYLLRYKGIKLYLKNMANQESVLMMVIIRALLLYKKLFIFLTFF